MSDVITVCSRSFINKVYEKISHNIKFESLAGELHWRTVENNKIKIDLYYLKGEFILCIGTKTKKEWEDFFVVQGDRFNCILYKNDLDVAVSRLKENKND